MENETSGKKACFVTLTYAPDKYPVTGLSKRDVQLFFKRLRKYLEKYHGKRIKYYLCGEYGENTERGHYHCIIIGMSPSCKFGKRYSLLPTGRFREYDAYTKHVIEENWKNGFVEVGTFSEQSAYYVSGYIQKKLNNSKNEKPYTRRGLQAPFALMSKGLGLDWILKNYDHLKKYMSYSIRGYKRIVSRYMRKVLQITTEEIYEVVCPYNQQEFIDAEMSGIRVDFDLDLFYCRNMDETYRIKEMLKREGYWYGYRIVSQEFLNWLQEKRNLKCYELEERCKSWRTKLDQVLKQRQESAA